jgi:hypothetical protein
MSAAQLQAMRGVSVAGGHDFLRWLDAAGLAEETVATVQALRRYLGDSPIVVEFDGGRDGPSSVKIVVCTDGEPSFIAAEKALEEFDLDYWLQQQPATRACISVHVA